MEKGNRKHPKQKSNKYQVPQSKSERIATVLIKPDSRSKIDAQTGNVSDLEMYMYLRDLTKHFATVLVNDATEVVGDNDEDRNQYLEWRIKNSGLNR